MLRLALLTTDNREDRRNYASPTPHFGTAPQALLDGLAAFPEEVEVHVLSCTREQLPSPLRLAPNIIFHSIHVPAWAWLKLGYLYNILAVRRCLAGIRPDVVHGHGTERDCALSAACSGYPNLITLHGNMRRLARLGGARPWSFAWLTARLEALAIRLAGGVLCLSEHTRCLAAPQAKRTWLVPNAVDPGFLGVERSDPAALPVILLVGDAVPNKNHLAFLEAMAPLQADLGFQVKLFGKCDPTNCYAAKLLHFIEHHPWCTAGGFLQHQAIRHELASAILLVLPSLEENLPMVILEAMAAGVPVAASKVGGIADLITDADTGRLFDPTSADSIRGVISSMLADPAGNLQLAARARDRIRRLHLPPTVARQHLEIYQQILEPL